MSTNILYTLIILMTLVNMFYIGYNTCFKTHDFFAKSVRLLGENPKLYRKHLKSSDFYFGAYKTTAFAIMVGSVLFFVVFIIQLIYPKLFQ